MNILTPRPTRNGQHRAGQHDRACDVCNTPMIGVIAGHQVPIRLAHDHCGGRPLTPEEREQLAGGLKVAA